MTTANHPGIIKLHNCFQDKKNLYFLIDLVPNGELFNYMKNEGVLDYNVAKFLAAEIVNMLHYMQVHKIAHRDIKPANLLFDDFMHLKLIDFGSGKFFGKTDDEEVKVDENRQSGGKNKKILKRQNTFVGTVEYMSPEIILGT